LDENANTYFSIESPLFNWQIFNDWVIKGQQILRAQNSTGTISFGLKIITKHRQEAMLLNFVALGKVR
jgi:hypothetical protein